uniref:Myopalladin n=1 Tax=Scleropages formosus TaxID=113540 RepID=A0A8C9RK24_SCLFO
MSRSDGTSHHLVYGGLLGKSEDVGGQDDFPDLSAFLSQEELDKSVNLARQAIGQGNHEERAEDMGLGGKPVSHKSRPPIDKREVPVSHPTSPDQQTFQPASKENVIKNNRPQKEPIQDFRKPVRNTPYGPETQSKKEFLNKAADFIEELSSLFKANSSKRIRPRACKAHRSRYKMKTQQDGSAFNAQDRERPIPPYTSQPDEQTEPPMEEEPELSLSKNSIQDESFDVDADEAESHQAKAPSPSQPQHSEGPIMEPPHFIQKLKSREVPEGSKVRLDCIVRGLPTPEVRWFCEGKELENSPDIQIITDGELHSLIIAEAFEEDTGRYSCFASNFYGTDSTSAEIYVEGGPSYYYKLCPAAVHNASVVTLNLGSGGPEPTPLNLQDLIAFEGQLVVLECRVKGVPSPRVEWYREGTMIEDSPDFRILQKKPRSMAESEEICTLVIAEVFPEDSGTFTCTAKNKYGTVSSIAYLKVKGKIDQHQLQILHNQVLLEQQQESTPPTLLDPAPWPPRLYHEQKSSPINLPNLPTSTFTPAATPTPASMTQSFNYTRPKEFIAAAQSLSPVRSLSPTESPVPMLNAMAAKMQQRPAADASFLPPSPAPNQFAPSPRMFPTRVLQSPTSPPGFVSSPTMVPPALLNSAFARRPQSPPQAPSPTSSSSTPSPIQNPVAFLSSVLPSLPASPPTNEMGLPKGAPLVSPQGMPKKIPKPLRSVSDDDIREGKETVLQDLEKKLRLRQESANNGQQVLTMLRQMTHFSGLCMPDKAYNVNNPEATEACKEAFFEYKVSNFEQRLMGEIEFRLERTPVEESDDEVQHDEIPTGKCIAPVFDKKLKNFRAMEGVPVTFTCKVVGIPIPKVYWFKDGKQILKKNEHYKRTREGDGTCSLHIEATTSDDDGNYTVMAANPQGRNSCSGHLIVQTGPFRGRLTPLIHSQRVRSRVQEVEEGEPVHERFFQPHFLQAPGDMVAHEGRLCRLDCKVSGLPNPDLMWLLKGRQIFPDLRHRMLVRENGVHSLLIDPLMQSDAGTYTCIATNKAGQSSFSLELNVMEKEVKKVPMFLERLQNTGIAEGNPVRLECRVAGMPPPVIYWKKDNDTISPNKDRVSMHQDATGYVCLLIQPTRKEDAGWYTVSAKNEAGIVSCTARLDIYAQWHQQIPQPTKIVRPSGSRYAALTIQGLDIMSAFPTTDNSPILFASSPVEAALESDEL